MYSLTISFGPSAMVWAFLFKEKEKADAVFQLAASNANSSSATAITDDFGQTAIIRADTVHGMMLEDLELVEHARIHRSLAEERCKVKLMEAAKSDPTIAAAIRQSQRGAPVLTPMGGFR